MEESDCIACWCEIDQENVCFYISEIEHTSQKSKYCWTCANCEAEEFYFRWQHSVDNADCASALRRMIAKGPPMTFTDVDHTVAGLFKVDSELKWQNAARLVKGDGTSSRSAHLDGAPATIQERDELWATLRERETSLPELPDEI